MKTFINIAIFILSTTIYSQDLQYLKKLDTIYIPFKQGKYNIKIDYPEEKDGLKNRSYIFNYKKNDSHYFDFELKKNPNKILEIRKADKSFLRKNKKNIIKIKGLEKFDYQDIQCDLFTRLKTFYIIDFSEKKDRAYIIYRVTHINSCISRE
ncbi:hypothetical protein C8C83_4011 [Flavobacterium sp. 90]|uniref:hypothetical protein n=1 Tax=unclassified Flavobacterium TaxID=196869 RepID=UPI000EAE5E93|nr:MULTISPECIES: hypothetical protein [unclassified Flavobacterium]RKR04678.1 hypothetical protein C8C82_4342 [Flavobacterium sp. 81]TCK56002.1 hypothetical protein C8C83_4011 [Flavobacterium sp. 90]